MSSEASGIYEFEMVRNNQQNQSLADYEGKVLLLVNTASKCGFTPQYQGLQALYDKYQDQGFEVLGFPCNQFGAQEPGKAEQIEQFCTLNFGVTFPLFDKIDVNGGNTAPLFQFLKKQAPGLMGTETIKWNFTKFLVGRHGQVVKRFSPSTTPEALTAEIEKLLAQA